jgi:hypothetical protein
MDANMLGTMTRTTRLALAGAALLAAPVAIALLAAPAAAQPLPSRVNDYPTEAIAEYVFACMAVNGQTQEALRRCSCSIDVVASILPYQRYVEAETVLALRQTAGERVAIMRTAESANRMVEDLRRAQAEGEIRCF